MTPTTKWRSSIPILFAAWCGWLSLRFLDLDADIDLETIGSALRGIGGATLGLIAAVGAGRGIWSRLNPTILEAQTAWLHCLVCGLLVWGLLGLGLGSLGLYGEEGSIAIVIVLLLGWMVPPSKQRVYSEEHKLRLPQLDVIDGTIIGLVLLIGLIDAVAPPVQTDELYYQLSIPARILENGHLPGGLLQPNGSRPLILHLPYASLLSLGGESAPRLFHLISSIALLLGVRTFGNEHLSKTTGTIAPLVLLGCGSFVQEFGLASNNLPTALCVLMALDAAIRAQPRTLAIASAAALSCKYSAAAPIAAIFLITKLSWRTRFWVGLSALCLISPWWVRNFVEGLHPLFPFGGWPTPHGTVDSAPMQFFFLEKYGAGRDVEAMLQLPWNMVMTSSYDTFRFLGRLNPIVLALFPLALLGFRRQTHRSVLVVATFSFVGWAAGAHWIRHLLPGLPVIALACASGLSLMLQHAKRFRIPIIATAWMIGFIGLPSNLGPVLQNVADRFAVSVGVESREDYLLRSVDGYEAISWANRHLPEEAKVALLFEWNGFLLERETLMGSVEDHIPTRHFLLTHQERSLSQLREMGVTHIFTRRIHFLHRLYPFLEADVFEANFEVPEEQLNALLLMEASLVYEADRCRIYRIDAD